VLYIQDQFKLVHKISSIGNVISFSFLFLQKKSNIDVDDDDDEFNHEIDYEESTYEEGLLYIDFKISSLLRLRV